LASPLPPSLHSRHRKTLGRKHFIDEYAAC
jgi:hypothetical protein